MIEDYERFDQEVPESLIAPELADIELAFWEAFRELSTERQVGMSAGPIPWSSIQRYVQEHPFVDANTFSRIIRAMDGAYLNHQQGESQTFTREMLKG